MGSLARLAHNAEGIGRIGHGLVMSCAGDAGGPTYKRSRCGNASIDRAMAHVLRREGKATLLDLWP
jgi:aminopeptidase-like protein